MDSYLYIRRNLPNRSISFRKTFTAYTQIQLQDIITVIGTKENPPVGGMRCAARRFCVAVCRTPAAAHFEQNESSASFFAPHFEQKMLLDGISWFPPCSSLRIAVCHKSRPISTASFAGGTTNA